MSYFAMLRNVEKWFWINVRNRINIKFNQSRAYQVWSTSITAFVGYLADERTRGPNRWKLSWKKISCSCCC